MTKTPKNKISYIVKNIACLGALASYRATMWLVLGTYIDGCGCTYPRLTAASARATDIPGSQRLSGQAHQHVMAAQSPRCLFT